MKSGNLNPACLTTQLLPLNLPDPGRPDHSPASPREIPQRVLKPQHLKQTGLEKSINCQQMELEMPKLVFPPDIQVLKTPSLKFIPKLP